MSVRDPYNRTETLPFDFTISGGYAQDEQRKGKEHVPPVGAEPFARLRTGDA
jgi:hypothetical protein